MMNILVVDDDADMAELLRDVLSFDGHSVSIAGDGVQALRLTRERHPDVVFCDIGLPGEMNGLDVSRAIRGEDNLEQPKLVALSGYSDPEDLRASAHAGFDLHLVKPVDIKVIKDIVSTSTGKLESRNQTFN